MKDFYHLFITELKDAYDDEEQIIKHLPHIIESAHSSKLKEALKHHLEETKKQLKRLDQIGMELNENLKGSECDAIRGILKEGSKLIHGYTGDVRDAAIIAACQRVEHYEMALYGILHSFACHLKLKNVEVLICETLKEEKEADKKLTEIAEGGIFSTGVNEKAIHKKSA